MTDVYGLRPNVTRAEAEALLQGRGLSGVMSRIVRGPLRLVAPLYIPFRAYAVTIRTGDRISVEFFAVDAVNGALDLYQFRDLPLPGDLVVVDTRNRIPGALDAAATRERVLDKVRRVLYQTGFFRLHALSLDARPAPLPDVHVPYWVGFFGADERVRLAVVDAVRRRPEGARVRDLVRRWLTAGTVEVSKM